MVDDQIGSTRIADLSCSTWSTVQGLLPLLLGEPEPEPEPESAPLIMHALFKNLNGHRVRQTRHEHLGPRVT
jgi:hypothetical protein